MTDHLSALSNDIIHMICAYLTSKERMIFRTINRKFRHVLCGNEISHLYQAHSSNMVEISFNRINLLQVYFYQIDGPIKFDLPVIVSSLNVYSKESTLDKPINLVMELPHNLLLRYLYLTVSELTDSLVYAINTYINLSELVIASQWIVNMYVRRNIPLIKLITCRLTKLQLMGFNIVKLPFIETLNSLVLINCVLTDKTVFESIKVLKVHNCVIDLQHFPNVTDLTMDLVVLSRNKFYEKVTILEIGGGNYDLTYFPNISILKINNNSDQANSLISLFNLTNLYLQSVYLNHIPEYPRLKELTFNLVAFSNTFEMPFFPCLQSVTFIDSDAVFLNIQNTGVKINNVLTTYEEDEMEEGSNEE